MSRLNRGCWVWSPRPPLCLVPQRTGSHREEEEGEEEEEHPAACCYTTGIPSSSGPAGRGPGAPSSQQPETLMDAGGGDASRRFTGDRCWQGPGTETRGCVCVYGQREPEGLGPCWPGSPYVYYGVRRNLVVGVEVVEEVAVEDTLEVITEDIYTDDLLDPELLQDAQLFPT